MTTRRDVAEAAGVSLRTVSNVVNGFPHIAADTRARVLAAIDRLGYRPSEVARTLRVGRSGLIGLMLPELDTPYFAELTRAFVERGAALGMTVVIDQTQGDRAAELAVLQRTARGALFDALVLSPIALTPADLTILTADQHVVFLGEEDFPGFDKVMIDNFEASRSLVSHMIERGRTRIASIGAQRAAHGASAQRFAGYQAALEDAGLPLRDSLIEHVDGFRRAEGARAMARLLDGTARPDAVFCFNDPIALGALRTLYERDVSVPDDVMVAGIDGNEEGSYSAPSLTTISPDKDWIARTALDRIARRLAGENLPRETLIGPYALLARESTLGRGRAPE